jgi:hypothetical protein
LGGRAAKGRVNFARFDVAQEAVEDIRRARNDDNAERDADGLPADSILQISSDRSRVHGSSVRGDAGVA